VASGNVDVRELPQRISSYEIHRAIKVTQKTGWFMLQRSRLALQEMSGGKIGGEVEVDEPFIGGKARNMHRDKRDKKITGTGGKDKAMVQGVVERGGKVGTFVVEDRKKKSLQKNFANTLKLALRSSAMR
jgi:hypothetical protein